MPVSNCSSSKEVVGWRNPQIVWLPCWIVNCCAQTRKEHLIFRVCFSSTLKHEFLYCYVVRDLLLQGFLCSEVVLALQ